MIPFQDLGVYRLIKIEKKPNGELVFKLDEDGIEEPDAEIVLIWYDKDGRLMFRWKEQDHPVAEMNVGTLDYTESDVMEVNVTMRYK